MAGIQPPSPEDDQFEKQTCWLGLTPRYPKGTGARAGAWSFASSPPRRVAMICSILNALARPLAGAAIAGLAVAVTLAVPFARPQGAEESVALFLWGLGEDSRENGATNRWAQKDVFGAALTFEIVQVGSCRYQVTLVRQPPRGGEALRFEYALNFAAV